MIENIGWQGKFVIKTKDGIEVINNRITNLALNKLRDALNGVASDLEIKYLALGTSNTAIDDTDTQLGTEIFRTQFTTKAVSDFGKIESTAIVLETEAVGSIREIGIFAGSTATSTVNSGVMISRILWTREKTGLESIQFTRIDTIGRA